MCLTVTKGSLDYLKKITPLILMKIEAKKWSPQIKEPMNDY